MAGKPSRKTILKYLAEDIADHENFIRGDDVDERLTATDIINAPHDLIKNDSLSSLIERYRMALIEEAVGS